MNYRNRTVCFALLFVTLGLHMAASGYGALPWVMLAVQFLLYPQLLYWRALRAQDASRTELNNMLIDTACFGAWAAFLAFPVWITFILCVGATVNLAVFHGPKGFAMAIGGMLGGALLVVSATGLQIAPDTNAQVTAMSITCVSLFLIIVSTGAYDRALKLHQTREQLRLSEHELKRQLNEIQELHARLGDQANRDPLTGLYNRRYLDTTMEREISRCKREGQPLTVMLIDIDFFKRVNDTYGHQAGDAVLRSLAAMLIGRTADVPCRYGGEEFLLLLPGMPLEVACERAEQLRMSYESQTVKFGELLIRSTLSIGVATYPGHGKTAEDLIGNADHALYEAKRQGRNRIVRHSETA